MKFISALFLVALSLQVPAQAVRAQKVLFIGIDGLRPDALMAANAPRMKGLIQTGAYSDQVQASAFTVSGPGWSTLMNGVWPDRHGVVDNSFNGRQYTTYPSFFTRLKQVAPTLKLGHWVTWEPIHSLIFGASPADYKVYIDYTQNGDQRVVDSASTVLAGQPIDTAFVYLGDVDVAGHNNGFHPSVDPYLSEIETNDQQVGQLLDAIRRRPTYAQEDWLILISTDHGGTVDGNHGRNEPDHREIFIIANGSSVQSGICLNTANQCDITATIWKHLGLTPNRAWNWASRPFAERQKPRYGVNLVYNGNAEANDGGVDGEDIGIAGWHDLSALTSVYYNAPNGYPTSTTPGPDSRGNWFFTGGLLATSRTPYITQTIDLRHYPIAESGHVFRFSAWLGGYSSQRDMMSVTARFLDQNGGELQVAKLGPVTPTQRNNQMKFLFRETTGTIPQNTTHVELKLLAEGQAGTVNDGYADNIEFVIKSGRSLP